MMRLSTRFYFRVAVLSLMLNFAAGGCEDDAVGLTDGAKIADSKFSSSSNFNASTPASNGRLDYTGGPSWCALPTDSTPYLEVDLGSVYILCAVATQGNSQADQWVKTYEIKAFEDRSSWNPYTEKGKNVVFQGNYDRNTEVKHYFYEGLQARYVRVYPKRHQGLVCLRLELFGQSKTDCSSTATGVEDSSKVPNDRFTASSKLNYPVIKFSNARLNHRIGWTPLSRQNVQNEWIQIDFGSSYFICAVATQGSGLFNEYVTKYKLNLSSNNKDWTHYTEGGTVREFIGNENRNQIKKNSLSDNVFGKFLRLTPLTFLNWPTVRMEVYGITQVCRSSLGMENRTIPDSQITASTDTSANGRLYNNGSAWCGTTLSTDYLQVDLGQSVTVTGLATQGDPSASNWVKRYLVRYSHDTTTWYDYKESGQNTKSFSGNTNQNSLFVNWFNNYVFARYIRVYPTSANGNPCLRVDFYGCIGVVTKPLVLLEDLFVSSLHSTVDLVCKITGQPRPEFQWQYKGKSISSSESTTNGIATSTHTISYTDAATVMLDHVCHRVNISTRHANCSSPPYVCKARYAGGKFAGKSTVVIVNLLTPDAVSDLAVESSTDDSATLKWSQPSSSGDMPVTSYKMEYSEALDGATTKTSTTTATSHVITGLKPYTNYSIRVMARSIIGEGLWSAPFQFTTDQAAPSKPNNLVIKSDPKHPRVTISWKAPTSLNGVINRYTVYYRYLPKGNVSVVSAKAGIMAVTVNIIGGMGYRFEVTATTVAEGEKEVVDQFLQEYAPDAAPGNFAFGHFNATTYNCSWDPPPRERSHGTIIRYDVSYTRQPTTRMKRSSDSVLVTTTNTHIMIYNMELCEKFKISVRAWTSGGAGPYNKELAVENVAMPPEKLKIVNIEKKSIEIEWTEVAFLGEKIRGYKVKYKGFKSYYLDFIDEGMRETNSRLPTVLVTNLVPGTRYQFQVATKAGCNDLGYSNIEEAVTKIDNPVAPVIPDILENTDASTAVRVTIWPVEQRNGPISFYQIIVFQVQKKQDILPKDFNSKLKGYLHAKGAGTPFYITAEIPATNVTSKTKVSVGDGGIQGEYINAKLEEGKRYKLFVRAVTRIDGRVYYGEYAKIADVTVRNNSCLAGKSNKITYLESKTRDLLGVIGAFAAIIIVLIATNAVSLWKLRKSKYKNNQCDKSENQYYYYDNIQSSSRDKVELEIRQKTKPPKSNEAAILPGHTSNLPERPSHQKNTRELPRKHEDGQLNRQIYMELQVSEQLQQSNTYAALEKKDGKTDCPPSPLYDNATNEDVVRHVEDNYEELPSEA